jgi:hypothetical protein
VTDERLKIAADLVALVQADLPALLPHGQAEALQACRAIHQRVVHFRQVVATLKTDEMGAGTRWQTGDAVGAAPAAV